MICCVALSESDLTRLITALLSYKVLRDGLKPRLGIEALMMSRNAEDNHQQWRMCFRLYVILNSIDYRNAGVSFKTYILWMAYASWRVRRVYPARWFYHLFHKRHRETCRFRYGVCSTTCKIGRSGADLVDRLSRQSLLRHCKLATYFF